MIIKYNSKDQQNIVANIGQVFSYSFKYVDVFISMISSIRISCLITSIHYRKLRFVWKLYLLLTALAHSCFKWLNECCWCEVSLRIGASSIAKCGFKLKECNVAKINQYHSVIVWGGLYFARSYKNVNLLLSF